LHFTPDVTVAAVVEKNGRFLMVEEQVAGRHVFNQPAGHLEQNESLIQAAVRETLEETAWHVEIKALVGIYLWESPMDRQTFLRLAFEARCRNHEPWRGLDEGICRAVWMTLVTRCIDDYLAGNRYPVDLLNHILPLPRSLRFDVSA
jgi:ADP-ribose pyrophosphatase YjhB (NUDIX family)